MSRRELALYGGVSMIRAWCEGCQATQLVVDGTCAGCGNPDLAENVKTVKRVSGGDGKRRYLNVKQKQEIVDRQGGACYLCDQPFGARHIRAGHRKRIVLRVEFDHVVPLVFAQSNLIDNFAAACHVCNRLKADLHAPSVEMYRELVAQRRIAEGYEW